VIIPEGTSILSADIQFNTECAKCLAGDTVRVNGSDDIRSRLVNCAVDTKPSSINCMHIPPFNNLPIFIDKNKVRDFNVLEVLEQRVDPKMVGQDWITDRNVTGTTFITPTLLTQVTKSLKSMDSYGTYSCHVFFAVLPFLFECGIFGSHLEIRGT
jgi:hypothetical protein